MVNRLGKELRLVLAWLIFPVLPVVLEDLYSQVARGSVDSRGGGLDPHDWGWLTWVIMLGPLVGYGFLAGATMSVPDDDPSRRRGLRRLLARRAVWVAIGPWWGALACAACVFGLLWLGARPQMPQSWRSTWIEPVILWGIGILGVAICGYSWLWPAWSALRRAARLRRWQRSLVHGAIVAAGFVGSLFGSFWAATALWRSYFFDPRIVRVLLVGSSLAVMTGCASTITYGEVRRRELFHAMLVAWVLGLALMWRWWSRPRKGNPPGAPGDTERGRG